MSNVNNRRELIRTSSASRPNPMTARVSIRVIAEILCELGEDGALHSMQNRVAIAKRFAFELGLDSHSTQEFVEVATVLGDINNREGGK